MSESDNPCEKCGARCFVDGKEITTWDCRSVLRIYNDGEFVQSTQCEISELRNRIEELEKRVENIHPTLDTVP